MAMKIEIDTGNAAFDDEARGPELARLLRELADKIEGAGDCYHGASLTLYDQNGNNVGKAEIDAA